MAPGASLRAERREPAGPSRGSCGDGSGRSVAALTAATATATLDHPVHWASANLAPGLPADVGEDAVRRGFGGRFWGYWHVIRAFAPQIAPGGSIALRAGAAARAALPGTLGGAAVNGAIQAMAKVRLVELAPLPVNTVLPGLTMTEAHPGMTEDARHALFVATAARMTAGRVGAPDDIARSIVFAAANPFRTDATQDVDHGLHLPRQRRPDMTDTLTATCHCGKVHVTLPAAAAGVLACHCGDCQKMHGNFNAFLAAPRAEIVVSGEAALTWYQSSADSRRAFCGTCGARVVKEITAAGRWLISAGLIDGPSGKRIIKNLWAASKPDWYDLPPAAT